MTINVKDARTSLSKAHREGAAHAASGGQFASPYRWGTRANVQWCDGYLGRAV